MLTYLIQDTRLAVNGSRLAVGGGINIYIGIIILPPGTEYTCVFYIYVRLLGYTICLS